VLKLTFSDVVIKDENSELVDVFSIIKRAIEFLDYPSKKFFPVFLINEAEFRLPPDFIFSMISSWLISNGVYVKCLNM
jgi:hypothetical protein